MHPLTVLGGHLAPSFSDPFLSCYFRRLAVRGGISWYSMPGMAEALPARMWTRTPRCEGIVGRTQLFLKLSAPRYRCHQAASRLVMFSQVKHRNQGSSCRTVAWLYPVDRLCQIQFSAGGGHVRQRRRLRLCSRGEEPRDAPTSDPCWKVREARSRLIIPFATGQVSRVYQSRVSLRQVPRRSQREQFRTSSLNRGSSGLNVGADMHA